MGFEPTSVDVLVRIRARLVIVALLARQGGEFCFVSPIRLAVAR